jgi:hypothetical protein
MAIDAKAHQIEAEEIRVTVLGELDYLRLI